MSARVEGVEPSLAVLETAVLPLNYTRNCPGGAVKTLCLLHLFMHCVLFTELAVFLHLQLLLELLLVPLREIGDMLADIASHFDQIFSRHKIIFTDYPEPPIGFEPTTYCLQNSCSTVELGRQVPVGSILSLVGREGFEPPKPEGV